MISKRSFEKELIDLGPTYYTEQEYQQCLSIMFHINRYLGMIKDTKKQLRSMGEPATLLDIGCGGGFFLRELARDYPNWQFIGIDNAKSAIDSATIIAKPYNNLHFLEKDAFDLVHEGKQYDIVTTSLFCHHLEDQPLIEFLSILRKITKKKIIIHDLHRHILAQYGYRLLSNLLTKNRLIRHDGLISIRRGFLRNEWQYLLTAAGFKHYSIQWRWPFRWMILA